MEFKLSDKKLKKILKLLPEGFSEVVESEDLEALKNRIKNIEQLSFETEIAMDADLSLNKAKQEVKGLAEDYKATLHENAAMTSYILYVLSERGES
jgi:hypothetical protein